MTMPRSILALVLGLLVVLPVAVAAQSSSPAAGTNEATGRPGSAGPKDDGSVAQRPGQPNAGEVRPGNATGDAPSASAGTLTRPGAPRVLGLSVSAVIVIVGVIVALFVIAGFVIPGARRRDRARGDGTYGRP